MDVELNYENGVLTAYVSGRVNTATAPQFEAKLISALEGVKELRIDMSELLYISSAGLRVVLTAQKIMSKQGSLTLCNLRPEVREVFDMTGFSQFITIE